MNSKKPFSVRHGIKPEPAPALEEAPESLRYHVLNYLQQNNGGYPSQAAGLIEQFLRRPGFSAPYSNPHNPAVWQRLYSCIEAFEWWKVYDFIEFIYANTIVLYTRERFAKGLNQLFSDENIPYRINDRGEIVYRGSEAFESAIGRAESALTSTGRKTANNEMHNAQEDLSRRPHPDLTGAVHHAIAALECVANDVCGGQGETLGQLIKRRPEKFPPPLGDAVSKLYGFASERGRHVAEGGEPDIKEVELIVGIAATVAAYLSR